MAEEPQV